MIITNKSAIIPKLIGAHDRHTTTYKEALWGMQRELHPDSRRVEIEEVWHTWCGINTQPVHAVLRQVVLTMQHENGVFYERGLCADGTYMFRGYRYGFEPQQYMGGFRNECN